MGFLICFAEGAFYRSKIYIFYLSSGKISHRCGLLSLLDFVEDLFANKKSVKKLFSLFSGHMPISVSFDCTLLQTLLSPLAF